MQNISSKAIINLLGERVRSYRIDYPMTQKELASKSGVSLRSVQNFEHGEDIQLSNFIKITKALDLGENLSMIVPDVSKKPSMYLEKTTQKSRVRKPKKQEDAIFKWGDEE